MADTIEVSIDIDAPPERVWAALTRPELVRTYMMGATLETDWQIGHPVAWSGEYQGKPYRDTGVVKLFEPGRRLAYTHWSPLSGHPDSEANHITVTCELSGRLDGSTHLTLTQHNLAGASEDQVRQTWRPILEGLKQTAEAA